MEHSNLSVPVATGFRPPQKSTATLGVKTNKSGALTTHTKKTGKTGTSRFSTLTWQQKQDAMVIYKLNKAFTFDKTNQAVVE